MILTKNLEIEVVKDEILLLQKPFIISITPEMVDILCAELKKIKEEMRKGGKENE